MSIPRFAFMRTGENTALRVCVSDVLGLRGDIDRDGDVDGLDFLALQRAENYELYDPLWQRDFLLWQRNYPTKRKWEISSLTMPGQGILSDIDYARMQFTYTPDRDYVGHDLIHVAIKGISVNEMLIVEGFGLIITVEAAEPEET